MLRRTFMQLCASFLALFGIGIPNAEAKTHLSTIIKVLVDGKVVGTINSLAIDEERDSFTLQRSIKMTTDRIMFDRKRVSEAFSRGFVHIQAQRRPFQIEISDQFNPGGNVTTYIKNCWMERMGKRNPDGSPERAEVQGDYVIARDVGLVAEDIWSDLNG